MSYLWDLYYSTSSPASSQAPDRLVSLKLQEDSLPPQTSLVRRAFLTRRYARPFSTQTRFTGL